MEWLQLLSNPSFMPHGHCYLWRLDILLTHVISDATIALSYYAIPVVLAIALYRRRQIIPYPEIVILFIAFIFLCGTTHFISILVTWHPFYEQQGWVKAATALVSVATAIVLMPKLPELMVLPGVQKTLVETQQELENLKLENKRILTIYDAAIEREKNIVTLKQEVNQLLAELNKPPKYLKAL